MYRDQPKHEKEMLEAASDAMRRRAAWFWKRRDTIGGWPIAPKGRIFLGEAVHRVGEKMFPDWIGTEPHQSRLPILGDNREYVGDGFVAESAAVLLKTYGGAHPSEFFLQDIGRFWVSSERMAEAIHLYEEHVAAAHRSAIFKMVSVMKAIVDEAAQENLIMCTRSDGGVRPSPAHVWATESAYARFSECQMNPSKPTIFHMVNPLDVWLSEEKLPDLLDGNEWLFIEAQSLQRFLKKLKPIRTNKVDRSPKKKVPDAKAREWWQDYLRQFPEPLTRSFEEALAAWRAKFPSAGTPQFKYDIWPTRPQWWGHRARKGT